jgi:hypothetical protein
MSGGLKVDLCIIIVSMILFVKISDYQKLKIDHTKWHLAQHIQFGILEMTILYFSMQGEENNWKTTPMLPPAWSMVLLHFQVSLGLYVSPKWTLWELDRGPLKTIVAFFKGEHLERPQISQLAPISPKGKPLNSWAHSWVKRLGSSRSPHYDWVDHRE